MRLSLTILTLLCLTVLPARSLWAEDPVGEAPPAPVAAPADKTLHPGESEVYEFDGMTTAAVGSPAVADIVPLSSCRLLVNAKEVGQTTLFVYDRRGQHRLSLAVVPPAPDLGPVAAQVQADIGLPGVTVRAIKDTVFLEGVVTNVVALQRASAIAGVYAPKFKNLIAVAPVSDAPGLSLAQTYAALLTASLKDTRIQVQALDDRTIALTGEYAPARTDGPGPEAAPEPKAHRARGRAKKTADTGSDGGEEAPDADVIDLSDRPTAAQAEESLSPDPLDRLLASLPSELKVVNLLNIAGRPARQILVHAKIISIDRNSSKSLGVNWGTLDPVSSRTGNGYIFQPQPIQFGQLPGVFYRNLLGGGPLQRISPLAAQLNILISENKARVLSEPSLMVLDGHEGSILVGGEIPVPVAQSSSGTNGLSASISVEYKPFGVRLSVAAALVGDDAVQMTVSPEVSDLDYSAAVQISGYVVPGLSVRRATTTLQMADGETLVIGGLYSNTATRHVDRIPLLSQIPVLGEFFKNTTTQKQENELLILIQPEIVKPDTLAARPPPPGSAENPSILKPAVGKADFDKDFPDLQHGGGDHEKPGPPQNLPPAAPGGSP